MWTLLNGTFALLTALCALWVWLHEVKRHLTLQKLSDEVKSIRGKLSQQKGVDREAIVQTVESYLEQRQPQQEEQSSGGMEEMLLPMLMQNMQGGQPQPQQQQQPSQQDGQSDPLTIGQGGNDGRNSE